MPFLRAAFIKKEHREVRIEPEIPLKPEVISGRKPTEPHNEQIYIKFPQKKDNPDKLQDFEEIPKTDIGREYEEYVGSLYEREGYKVTYNGKGKGSHDGGIDLICKKDNYTILVQCKCYDSKKVTLKDICYLYASSHRYMLKHPQEVVRSSFWTTRKIEQTSEVFKAAVELGILLYENTKRED